MTASKIEWTDRSDWNPIRGCTRISPGCGGPGNVGGCYAEVMAARFSDPGQWGYGYAERTAKGGRWTGKVEVQWDRLTLPIRWRNPAKIFASSTSDFFHAALVMTDIAQLFGVMIAAHHLRGHTFQVLTKRADLMRKTLTYDDFWHIANAEADSHIMRWVDPLNRRSDDARATLDDYGSENPPPGIWLGVSVEDQQRADERIPDLLTTPAAVRWLSCEPLLGPVDLRGHMSASWEGYASTWTDQHGVRRSDLTGNAIDGIDWVVAGGESGPGARPMHPDWARSLRDQCAEAGVPFFFKQWGEWMPTLYKEGAGEDFGNLFLDGSGRWAAKLNGPWKSAGPNAGFESYYRVGKKAAGRLLDGVEHNGMPA